MGEDCCEIAGGGDGSVSGGGDGHDDVDGKPCECIGYTLCSRGPYPHTVTSIMMYGWAKVPCIYCVWCPGFSYFGHFVDKYFGARRSEGCAIKIKRPKELGVC